MPSLAWVANPKPNSARALSTTQLEMFDWFNKDKPTEKANTKEKETDFFSNFFNQASPSRVEAPPKHEISLEESPEHEANLEESPKHEANLEEPKAEEPKILTKVDPSVVEAAEPKAATPDVSAKSSSAAPAAAETEIHHGTVRWFDRKRGYGFIDPASSDPTNGKTVFVHQSDLKAGGYRFLFDGEIVEYHQEVDKQGRFRAIDVTGPGGGHLRISLARERDAKKQKDS